MVSKAKPSVPRRPAPRLPLLRTAKRDVFLGKFAADGSVERRLPVSSAIKSSRRCKVHIEYSKFRLRGCLRTTSSNRFWNSLLTDERCPERGASFNPSIPSELYRCSHLKTVTELSRTISAISCQQLALSRLTIAPFEPGYVPGVRRFFGIDHPIQLSALQIRPARKAYSYHHFILKNFRVCT